MVWLTLLRFGVREMTPTVVETPRSLQYFRGLANLWLTPPHLWQVFYVEAGEQPVTEHDINDNKLADDNTFQEPHVTPPGPITEASSQQRRLVQYEKRLELAELSIAIAESVKMWVSVVPWRVRVLSGGQLVLWTLRIEEETLPWPPDPGLLPDADGENLGESVVDSEGEQ